MKVVGSSPTGSSINLNSNNMRKILRITKNLIKAYISAYSKVMQPLYDNNVNPLPF